MRRLGEEFTAWSFFPNAGPYGKKGIPDIIGCIDGLFFAIEVKAGKEQPTELQQERLNCILDNGGIALHINDENFEEGFARLHDCIQEYESAQPALPRFGDRPHDVHTGEPHPVVRGKCR